MGNGVHWGHYNLYFEALKGLLLKNAPIFFPIFAENVMLLSQNITKLIPFGASTSKYKKFAFSMWLYKDAKYWTRNSGTASPPWLQGQGERTSLTFAYSSCFFPSFSQFFAHFITQIACHYVIRALVLSSIYYANSLRLILQNKEAQVFLCTDGTGALMIC